MWPVPVELRMYLYTKINACGFTENSMSVLKNAAVLLMIKQISGDYHGLLQHILQFFCWSSGGVLWADIFQHSRENTTLLFFLFQRVYISISLPVPAPWHDFPQRHNSFREEINYNKAFFIRHRVYI